MVGRDPHEQHRVATPLELLFDLTFATSFGVAAFQFAEAFGAAHYGAAFLGFGFAASIICWAWVNFSWFASAYDTDDWVFRVATMVQMTGVLILAIGLPPMFKSIGHGVHLDASGTVLGYVVMRAAMVFQWSRAAWQDPRRRRACLTYAITISIAQIGWVAWAFLNTSLVLGVVIFCVLWSIEFAAPWLAERKDGGTPWHAHHIAERYSLFAVIALGESVVGTVDAMSAVIGRQGWTLDAVLVCVAGVGLTFGLWWVYYLLPSGRALHEHRSRAFAWAYAQMFIVTSIIAVGAGLRVAALFVEGKTATGALGALLTVAVPVGVFIGLVYGLYHYLVRRPDPLHVWLLAASAVTLAGAVVAAVLGVEMAICLVVVTCVPAITVVGYEVLGYRHQSVVGETRPLLQ